MRRRAKREDAKLDPSSSPGAEGPRPLLEDLHWLFARLARGLGAAQEPAVRRHGLSLRGYVALSEIVQTPMATQLAVARATALDKSVLVGILDELEKAGFVARTPDPNDRRARQLSATDAGRAALLAATAEVRAIEDKLFGGATLEQRRTFVEVLQIAMTSGLAETFDTKPCV